MAARCSGGTRPVIFKIERIDVPETDEEAVRLAKQDYKKTRRRMPIQAEKKRDLQGDRTMELKRLEYGFTVCKVAEISEMNTESDFYFIGKTDEELSMVCKTEDTPANTTARDDGWRGFRIQGILDFSLIGILSEISGILAANKIGIFAVSTYNTDYILVKEGDFDRALEVLSAEGYTVI